MKFEYQKYGRFFAPVAGKMEEMCAEEFRELGAKNVHAGYRGVSFEGDQRTLYRINYESRLATRVVAPLQTFNCHSAQYLIDNAAKIPWDKFLSVDETFAITASVSDSHAFTNSLFAAQCLKDGVADYFNAKYNRRPSVDLKNPDLRLNLHIRKNRAVISIDTSGNALHKRGYRKNSVYAPMQETLAAAIVRVSGWSGETKLWDFMCGSGTLLAEAHMAYCRIPAQYLRKKFGFMSLPDFDETVWKDVKSKALAQMRPLPKGLIEGSDKSDSALEATRENLQQLPYSDAIDLKWRPFQSAGNFENGTIICNPPYGIRLGDRDETVVLYKEVGDFLKKQCNGTTAYIYTGDKTLARSFGLKPSNRVHLVNGQLEGILLEIKSFKVTFRKDGDFKADKNESGKSENSPVETVSLKPEKASSVETPSKPVRASSVETSSLKPARASSVETLGSKPSRVSSVETPSSKPRRASAVETPSSKPARASSVETPSLKPKRASAVETSSLKPKRASTVEGAPTLRKDSAIEKPSPKEQEVPAEKKTDAVDSSEQMVSSEDNGRSEERKKRGSKRISLTDLPPIGNISDDL